MGCKITIIKLGLKTLLCLVVVWLTSLPLYAVDIDGDGLQDYQVAAGSHHTCVIDNNGLHCWGRNHDGETDVPTDLVNPVAVAASHHQTCAIDDNGLHCWGLNSRGQTDVPTGLVNPVAVAMGYYHTCAIDSNGLHCWGYNYSGQTDVPTDLVNPVAVAAGYYHTCAIDSNGLHCWGYYLDWIMADLPTDLVNPRAIAVGWSHACALDNNGMRCWGSNSPKGWVGTGCPLGCPTGPLDVPTNLVNPVSIAAENKHSCVIDNNGVHCFGWNSSGQIDVPTDLVNPREVFSGMWHNCALDDNGLQCWGSNLWTLSYGQSSVPTDLVFDRDSDGVEDKDDDFPLDSTETTDTDGDGIGNNTDTDDDGDGFDDTTDNCPLTVSVDQLDTDADGSGNACDTDDDNDGTLDVDDPYPLVKPPTLTFNYAGDTDKPIAGISLTLNESDGATTTLSTDINGQVALPATIANPYTLSGSFTASGDESISLIDAIWILQHSGELRTLTGDQQKAADVSEDGDVDILDAIWILQHLGELRTLSPSLVFLDTATDKPLSETTFSPTDTPNITVIRMGDVDQSYDPTAVTGASLSAKAKTVAIGALGNDDNSSTSGHNRIYDWDGRNWVQREPNIDLRLKSDLSSQFNTDFNISESNELPYLDLLDNEVELNRNEISSLIFTYANSSTPIAGVKVIMTESNGTVTILVTDVNGQVTLPSTTNTYTLTASLSETGDDPITLIDAIHILQYSGELRPLTADQKTAADVNADGEVDILDAIWILQHLGELRLINQQLVFFDANTGNSLSETTFTPADTPSISVIRKGDVDGDFDPSTTNAPDLDWVITSKSKAYDYSEVDVSFASSATISDVVLSSDEGGLTLVSFEDNAIKLLTPIVFQDTEFAYSLTITDSANNSATLEQTMLVELYKHPLDAFTKLSTIYTENFNTEDYAVFNFSFDAIHTAELYTETVCYEGCIEKDGYFVSDFHNGMWGNFNGDGHEDFVVTWAAFPHTLERDGSSTLSNIEIYLNNGEGRLIRNRDIYVDGVPPSSHMLYRTAVADFNKDGIDDIFAVAMGLIQSGVDGENIKDIAYPHVLLLSTPEGKFRDASSIIEGNTQTPCATSSSACNLWAGHNSASGDVNGDGYPDLSIGHKLFLNENGEKFVDVTDQLPSAWEDQNLYPGPMTTEIQDFNNDGFGDLVMFWADSAGLDDPPDPEILLSNGTANISEWTRQDLPVGYFGDGLTKFNNKFSGDIDGDGDLDMVTNTTRTNPSYYAGRFIQVLINDGNGNFTDNSFAALGEQPRAGDYTDPDYTHFCDAHGEGAIFLRDYDGDDDLDIIDVGPGGETPTSCASPNIFLNNGTGVFSELAVDWAWVQGTQVEGWETWLDSGAARPPEGRKIKKVFPINLDNKNKLDFVSWWQPPAQDTSGTSVDNIANTYQIMSKK